MRCPEACHLEFGLCLRLDICLPWGMEQYQYHIILAWAVTIHKVQGLSLDRAVMDLGKDVFAHGMAYIALSRVKSLEGVCVVGLSKSAFQKNDDALLLNPATQTPSKDLTLLRAT